MGDPVAGFGNRWGLSRYSSRMKLIESLQRHAVAAFGVDIGWLREELALRGVRVPLPDSCLRELAAHAQTDARLQATHGARAYLASLRQQIASRAEFIRVWTQSDESIRVNDVFDDRALAIARNYALPRPWKLSEPAAAPCRRPTPIYLRWASAR